MVALLLPSNAAETLMISSLTKSSDSLAESSETRHRPKPGPAYYQPGRGRAGTGQPLPLLQAP
jgi:hypothetical protein